MLSRLKPLYVSLNVKNNNALDPEDYDPNSTADEYIVASVSEVYRSPIVDKASDYLVAVERFECSLNGIPFYDGLTVPEFIIIRSRLDDTLPVKSTQTDFLAFSLSHLFTKLNGLFYEDPNNDEDIGMTFTVTADGFIKMYLDNASFQDIQVEFPRRLNQILGISSAENVQISPNTDCTSTYPRIDCGDDLDHLVLRTNLPTSTDSIGNVKLPVMTDFAPPSAYGNSMAYDGANGGLVQNSFSTNIRQKIIYVPAERRYLELLGDFPVNNIDIDVFYVTQDDALKPVPLPFGALFEIKIGFYLKH